MVESVIETAEREKVIRAQPGPQEAALASPADMIFMGGQAGGSKSWSLLLTVVQNAREPTFYAEIFRRTYPELTMTGGLWPESFRIYPHIGGAPREGLLGWRFPSGAKVKFSHMQHPQDRFNWKGAQIPMIGFDQVESFTAEQFWYMVSRNRDPSGRVTPWIFATCNPVPEDDAVGGWLNRLISWWINKDTGYAIEERSGAIRWMVREEDRDDFDWADDPADLRARHPRASPRSVTFIHARLEDNPALLAADPDYRARLELLPRVERERLLGGNWKIRATAGTIFSRGWFRVVQAAPTDVVKWVRYWDKAGTQDGGKYSAGVLMGRRAGGRYIVADVVRGRWSAANREAVILQTARADARRGDVDTWVEQEPGPIWEAEPIRMEDGGEQPLATIQIGDRVITQDGHGQTVTSVHEQGVLSTLAITTESGRVLHVAPSHPLLTPRGWTRASDLTIGDRLGLRSHITTRPSSFPRLEECRLAGYFVGDGCCTAARSSINANVVCSDQEQGFDIWHCASALGFHVHLGGSRGWTYYLSGGSREWLRKRHLAGQRTETKQVPAWVVTASDEHVAHFLGAYFACDGGVTTSPGHPSVEYYGTNRGLLETVQGLLLRFGVYTMLRERRHSRNRRRMYRLVTRRHDDSMAKFAERIPVFGRKGKRLSVFRRVAFNNPIIPDPIISIATVDPRPCRCLTLDTGESFLVHDVIVHNSGGKESAENTIKNLAGYVVRADRVTGAKVTRADPLAAQAEVGNVDVLEGEWNEPFLAEYQNFDGVHGLTDQVDAGSGAFNKLALQGGPIEISGAGAPGAPRRVTVRL